MKGHDNMNMEELLQAAEAIRLFQGTPQQDTGKALTDTITKVAVAICTAGVLWLVSSVNTLQKDFTEMNVKQTISDKTLEKLIAFTDQPRFTAESFQGAIQPLVQRVEQNANEISLKRSWVSKIEPVVMSNQRELEFLKKDILDMKRSLGTIESRLLGGGKTND